MCRHEPSTPGATPPRSLRRSASVSPMASKAGQYNHCAASRSAALTTWQLDLSLGPPSLGITDPELGHSRVNHISSQLSLNYENVEEVSQWTSRIYKREDMQLPTLHTLLLSCCHNCQCYRCTQFSCIYLFYALFKSDVCRVCADCDQVACSFFLCMAVLITVHKRDVCCFL